VVLDCIRRSVAEHTQGLVSLQFAMPSAPQSRRVGYCFTLNNWTEEEYSHILGIPSKYLIVGKEIGESGTPHLQGYIHFERNVRFNTVKKYLPRAHIEQAKGTAEQNADYCKKDGNFHEQGSLPKSKGDASKEAYANILKHAEDGDMDWIKSNYPRMWIQLSHRLESLQRPKGEILDGELRHEWWVGPTGSGKSRLLWELYPEHFQKDTNKWWCGYRHQDVVAIEEWSPKNECTGSFLKIWADRYPFTGQIKGGSLQRIRPVKLIVLSNYEIDDCFPDSRDAGPLHRRFATLRFPQARSTARSRAQAYHHSLVPECGISITSSDTAELTDDALLELDLSDMPLDLDALFNSSVELGNEASSVHDGVARGFRLPAMPVLGDSDA